MCALQAPGTVPRHSIRIAAAVCLDRTATHLRDHRRCGRWKPASASSCEVYLRGAGSGNRSFTAERLFAAGFTHYLPTGMK